VGEDASGMESDSNGEMQAEMQRQKERLVFDICTRKLSFKDLNRFEILPDVTVTSWLCLPCQAKFQTHRYLFFVYQKVPKISHFTI